MPVIAGSYGPLLKNPMDRFRPDEQADRPSQVQGRSM